MEGYRALRESAAWINLAGRGKIHAFGDDRARLLHAMTTNHVQQLQPGQGCYAFFLNAQGRILGDVNLFCLADRLLLDVEPETRLPLYLHLEKYIIADDVTLEDASESLPAMSVEGPEATAVLRAAGIPLPAGPFEHAAWDGRMIGRLSITGAPGFRIYGPPLDLGISQADAEAVRVVRIENGKPRYGEDIFDTTLTAETRQTHAVHFSKGCYLGQEVVERVRSRGHVNRMLVGVEIEGTDPVALHASLTSDGVEAGKMCSSAFSPARGMVVGMAYVRVQQSTPGTMLLVDGRPCRVRPSGRE